MFGFWKQNPEVQISTFDCRDFQGGGKLAQKRFRSPQAVPFLLARYKAITERVSAQLRSYPHALQQALLEADCPETRAALFDWLHDQNADCRRLSMAVLSELADERAVKPALLVAGAAKYYGKWDDDAFDAILKIGPKGRETLIAALSSYWHQDYWVDIRIVAIRAMQRMKDDTLVEALVRCLTHKPDLTASDRADLALHAIATGRSVNDLIAVCAQDEQPDMVRIEAAEALGTTGHAIAVEPLLDSLNDDSEEVRAAAATALGNIGDQRAVSALELATHDQSRSVAKAARAAVQKLSATKSAPIR